MSLHAGALRSLLTGQKTVLLGRGWMATTTANTPSNPATDTAITPSNKELLAKTEQNKDKIYRPSTHVGWKLDATSPWYDGWSIKEWGQVQEYVPARAHLWKPFPKDYKEHPDRDLVNFPHPELALYPSKVRLGFLPDSWFNAFYKKTGVTGPYLFFGTAFLTLTQKEIYTLEERSQEFLFWFIFIYSTYMAFGHRTKRMWDDYQYAQVDSFTDTRDKEIEAAVDFKHFAENMEKSYVGMIATLPEVKRENVALQLEAAYRQRLADIYKETKRRADYLVQSEEVKRRFEQKHMVKWIVDQVMQSFTPAEEKAMMSKCIADLKTLAKA